MADWTPFVVAVLAFGAMAGIAFVAGQYYLRESHLQRRLPVPQAVTLDHGRQAAGSIGRLVTRHFDEKRFGVDDTLRGKLRMNLIRAGYFRKDAINFYVFWRVTAVIVIPIICYVTFRLVTSNAQFTTGLVIIVIATVVGIVGPDAFVARRQRLLGQDYRKVFPDFLDLLIVCIDAGLSLEAAIARITGEMARRNRYFGINLAVMAAEMRAGRSFVDALGTLADRLVIAEARSLVAVLRQAVELGSDIGEALRIFGDEMRDRRLLLAEERANTLSVKMIFPLGFFILPVVLMVVLIPVLIRLAAVFH
jgi:tight adherence protein C